MKYLSSSVSEELYNLSQNNTYESFVDLLQDIVHNTSIDSRQLDILIRIDYFADFGNQVELTAIANTFLTQFKSGEAKQIAREKIDGTAFESAVKAHSTWINKDGSEAKNYKLQDVNAILHDIECVIRNLKLNDASIQVKIQAQKEYFGHVAATGEEADRTTLVVDAVYDLRRKKDGKQFGYSVIATSLGSGKQTRYTVFNRDWNRCGELDKGEIIRIEDYRRDGEWFTMTSYSVL